MPFDDTHALVLAAGAGRRFGGGKLLASLSGKPLVLRAVEAALKSDVAMVTVVLGSEAERVEQALSPSADARLRTLVCAEWDEGMSASLRCGINSLPANARAALIFLGDMPDVPVELADRVLAAVVGGAPAALPVCNGRPAHPVAVARALFADLQLLAGDRGARELLETVPGAVRIATNDPGSIRDVDTPEDLRDLQAGDGSRIWS